MKDLEETFGSIDIYLFDQLLKGRLTPPMRVLDAGCGDGRNLLYLLRNGFEVWGVDQDPDRLERARELAQSLRPDLPPGRFCVESLEDLSLDDASFDFVISSAVLHFAPSVAAFDAMVTEMWRVLAPGGILFARLASTIGIEDLVVPVRPRWYRIPDGTERFLVDEAFLRNRAARLGGAQLEPIKTTVVERLRAMTTWVLEKRPADGG
jgi:SAM-dependent methyltransferase